MLLDAAQPTSWEHALNVLRGGGVAVLPTDTLYGLHALARCDDAVTRIAHLKGLEETRRFVHLAADAGSVWSRAMVSDSVRAQVERAWPGPLTAIVPLQGPDTSPGTVAWRVPAHLELRRLIEMAGGDLVSTSVNRTGQKPMVHPGDIRRAFDVDLILDAGVVDGPASTVVDCTQDPPAVVRRGAYDWAATTGSNPSN